MKPIEEQLTYAHHGGTGLSFDSTLHTVAKSCGAVVGIVGVTVLCGWALNLVFLERLYPAWPKMAAATALGFVLGGGSLAGATLAREKARRLWVSQIGGALVLALGLLKLGDRTFGWNFPIDGLGFREAVPLAEAAQMSLATALGFLLVGAALLLAARSRMKGVFQAATVAATLIGWLGVCHFLSHNAPPMPFAAMAFHTALCFLFLGAGVFCARTDGGMMALLASQSPGGWMARRLLLPILLLPLGLNWFESWVENTGKFSAGASWAINMIDDMVVFGALVWGNAFLLDRADAKREQAETARAQLANIVESSDEAIIGKTLDGIITSWNQGAEKIFGYAASEVIGQPMLLLFPPERTNEESEILARIAHGENVENFETVRIRKDKKQIHVSATISPVKDPSGRIIGASKIAHDITARKRAEDALRASQELLRFVTENARVGMVMVNLERRYTFANAAYAEILGLPSADIVGQPIADVLSSVYEAQIRPRLDRAFAGERVAYELNKVTGGKDHCYAVRYEPTVTERNEPVVVVVITDITERKKADEAIRTQLDELQRWHEAMIGREDRILELKDEVNALLARDQSPPRYPETAAS